MAAATRQDLTVSVSGTATLQPADSYNVTTLLSGDIVSASFEEGDLVAKDTLLYTMDSSDAQDSMDRAQISVQQAQLAYQQAQEALHPTATISGTVSEVYVHNGESVNAGAQLAKIVASTELSIDFLFPFASPSDFYVGQSATVFVDGYAGSQMGTVTYVSNSSTITSNGKQAVSVRVRLNNPGAVSDAVTASAVIGNYTSYGQSPVSMPASTIVYAAGSGTVNDFHQAGRQHGDEGRGAVHRGVRDHPGSDRKCPAEPAVRPAQRQHRCGRPWMTTTSSLPLPAR